MESEDEAEIHPSLVEAALLSPHLERNVRSSKYGIIDTEKVPEKKPIETTIVQIDNVNSKIIKQLLHILNIQCSKRKLTLLYKPKQLIMYSLLIYLITSYCECSFIVGLF